MSNVRLLLTPASRASQRRHSVTIATVQTQLTPSPSQGLMSVSMYDSDSRTHYNQAPRIPVSTSFFSSANHATLPRATHYDVTMSRDSTLNCRTAVQTQTSCVNHVNQLLIPISKVSAKPASILRNPSNESNANVNVVKIAPGQRVAVRLGRSGIMVRRPADCHSHVPMSPSYDSQLSPCSSNSDLSSTSASASSSVLVVTRRTKTKAKKRVNFAPLPPTESDSDHSTLTPPSSPPLRPRP